MLFKLTPAVLQSCGAGLSLYRIALWARGDAAQERPWRWPWRRQEGAWRTPWSARQKVCAQFHSQCSAFQQNLFLVCTNPTTYVYNRSPFCFSLRFL